MEKAATNAVMAGCLWEYFPVVLTVIEAALEPAFSMHGLLATLWFSGPAIIVQAIIERCGVVVVGLADCGSCTSCSLHDIATLDRRGIPGCAIATEAFQPAAAAQARTLGFDPVLHWVPHPIQNRTAEELAIIADGAIDEVLKLISA